MDEVVDEVVSLVVIGEAVLTAVSGIRRRMAQGFGNASVEALDHAVGLRLERPCQAMVYGVGVAHPVEGVTAGRLAVGLVLHVDGEAVGELGTVVGQDSVDALRKGVEALPILRTSMTADDFAFATLDWFARLAPEHAGVASDEARAWLDDLLALQDRGRFFFCVNRFLFSGVRV